MKTEIIKIHTKKPEKSTIRKAASLIKRGKIVAFPTETVYGLGANALDARAVKRIFNAKGRPADNPLIVHISDGTMLHLIAKEIPSHAFLLMEKFWPGPLTIVLKKKNSIPSVVTAGGDTIAVRMPDHPVAYALIKEAGVPIAAPSANASTRPSPTTAAHVIEDMNGKTPLILDGGKTHIGIESTVLDLTTRTPALLRKGKITLSEIEKIIGSVVPHTEKKNGRIKSPGQKYRHYAPKAKLILVSGGVRAVRRVMREYTASRIFVITFFEKKERYSEAFRTFVFGRKNDTDIAGKNFFSLLRRCDRGGADIIIVEEPPKNGVGDALIDRISRAASRKI